MVSEGSVNVASPRATAALLAASAVSAAAGWFGQIMLLIGGLGGIIGSFLQSGVFGAIVFLIVWSVIGATLWTIGFGVLTMGLAAVAYGIVWLVYPNGWPNGLRWVMVAPAALVAFVLATLVNVLFRYIELFFPLNGLTAVGSLFFVSFVQTAAAVVAAGWIAPAAKHTVRVAVSALFCVFAAVIMWLSVGSSDNTLDVPRWANLVGILLGPIGAILATLAMSRASLTTLEQA